MIAAGKVDILKARVERPPIVGVAGRCSNGGGWGTHSLVAAIAPNSASYQRISKIGEFAPIAV